MGQTEVGTTAWLHEIAGAAGMSLEVVRSTLEQNGVHPSPVVPTPKRLTLREIEFSGAKVGCAAEGPFRFLWEGLGPGLWAAVAEKNFRGKTSILEVVRWMLRGRFTDNLRDVRTWIHAARLRFGLGHGEYEVHLESRGGVDGGIDKLSGLRRIALGTFNDDASFEDLMGSFFLRELGLDPISISRATSGSSSTTVHSWPALSGALFIGTDYSVLLGDISPGSGLTVPLMQMYLGLPWVSTLTAARAAKQSALRVLEDHRRKSELATAQRTRRADTLRLALAPKQQELSEIPSDEALRAEGQDLHRQLIEARTRESELLAQCHEVERSRDDAEATLTSDRRELRAHLDAVAAGAIFRTLKPTVCPRCEHTLDATRERNESTTNCCFMCSEPLPEKRDKAIETLTTELRDRERASLAALNHARNAHVEVLNRLTEVCEKRTALEAKQESTQDWLKAFDARRRLEIEIAQLRGSLTEAELDTADPPPLDQTALSVLDAALAVTESRVKSTQGALLARISDRIRTYANAFGMTNLAKASLKGNAQLRLQKGGTETSFSYCTEGEKLRLKVATVLAMIGEGEASGVGCHPGLLVIDSPGAQEVAKEDLEALVTGLGVVAKDLSHLQVIIAAMHTPAIVDNVPTKHLLAAKGEDALW